MIKVSVVVATYKRDKDLANALTSLAKQSYSNFEIVLVDDNGNEEWNQKVFDIVTKFRYQFPEVALQHIVNDPNQGSAKTRNIGIEAARGEYVTFLDDDDVYLPQKIKRQIEFMEAGNYDYSITDLDLFDENDKLIDKRVRTYMQDFSPEALLCYHLKYHMTGTDTMMFKKSYLQKIGGFAPIDVGDEFYLMQRAIEGRGTFGYLPACDIKAYVHSGEEGLSSGESKIKGENALFKYKKQYFKQVGRGTRRYIRMRHYAVIAFAQIRRRKYFSFCVNAIISFCCAPMACIVMFFKRR